MECGCKENGEPGQRTLEPCSGHLEWMKALVRAELEEAARVADGFAAQGDWDDDTCKCIAASIRARTEDQ